jgi:subtilisin family serine protease
MLSLRQFIIFLVFLTLFPVVSHAAVATINQGIIEGEILVQLRPSRFRAAHSIAAALPDHHTIKSQISETTLLLSVDDTMTTEQALEELQNNPAVLHAQPNYQYTTYALDTDDTHRGLLWGLDSSDDQDIDAPEAWQISEGQGIVVAVIDTGVAYNHPDLLWNMWNGNQCVDDAGVFLGWCLVWYDFEDNDTNPLPTSHTHGTHVAGTIAAIKNNNHGVIWVAPQAKIMALKSSLTTAEIVRAIAFAENNGAKIINASWWGTSFDQLLYDAIESFSGLFVAAAGNSASNNDSTTHHYPSDYTLPNIISVAATNDSDNLSGFSNYWATSVDLWAPGQSIYSTIVSSSNVYSQDFSSSIIPQFPDGFLSTGTWQTYNSPSRGSIVAQWDNQLPYSDNTSQTLTSPTLNLSWLSASFSFFAQCDTKYILTGWEDYMSLEYSSDGVNFYEAYDPFFPNYPFYWDEAYLDSDRNESGSASFSFSRIAIPSQYMTGDFRFRFRWNTDNWDNNYIGCSIDDVSILSFSDGSAEEYGYLSGTSMAAPHVAGAAALLWWYDGDLTVSEVKEALVHTGDSLSSLAGKTVSGKRLNVFSALRSLPSASSIVSFDIPWKSQLTVITHETNTIDIYVPEADFPFLTPNISIAWASLSPASGVLQDFTHPIVYTVTAPNGSTRQYTVTVYPIEDDKSSLTTLLDAEIGVDHDNPVYVRVEAEYTPESWNMLCRSYRFCSNQCRRWYSGHGTIRRSKYHEWYWSCFIGKSWLYQSRFIGWPTIPDASLIC